LGVNFTSQSANIPRYLIRNASSHLGAGAKEETEEISDPPITTCVYDRVTGKRIFGKFLAKGNKEDETEQSRQKRLCLQNSVIGSRPIQ